MKHTFMLDLNLLYHAIHCVDEHDQPSTAAADLVEAIGRNCHRIVLNTFLLNEYQHRLSLLARQKLLHDAAVRFITQLLKNSGKQEFSAGPLPELPPGCEIPAEDIEITRHALASGAIFVTADGNLREAIQAHLAGKVTVVSPHGAMEFAAQS